ncbi:hypothetical protein HAX54_026157 [Datura stramonium]|uniref:Cyclin N-terminal domain-containing protein n=1 Tax=Datura stramonium TaxID=4076 RepID=A0ABS8S770_DATST|nr:hypothetical protein [Datura stramonium]
MDSLLCDEVWFMSPIGKEEEEVQGGGGLNKNDVGFFYSTKEDCEQAFGNLIDKEMSYMPEEGYVKFIEENSFIEKARLNAIYWFMKLRSVQMLIDAMSQRRWDLSFLTVFGAASYLDRFISLNKGKCQVWRHWLFELLSIACLSLACKFHEASPPQLLELKMEGIEHVFHSAMIQRMEFTLLEALGWKLNSATPYSYIELFQWSINSHKLSLLQDFTSRINELFVRVLLDVKLLEFKPCVIAQSVVTRISEDMSPLIDVSWFSDFTRLIPQDQKDDLNKCQTMMNTPLVIEEFEEAVKCRGCQFDHSSPVSVLTMKQRDLTDYQLRQYYSLFNSPQRDTHLKCNDGKRKRDEEEEPDRV